MSFNKRDQHPLAGQTVLLLDNEGPSSLKGVEYAVEDWWVNVYGKSWMVADGNPAALAYAIRAAMEYLPTDDEVVYGKIRGTGVLVHSSELPTPEDLERVVRQIAGREELNRESANKQLEEDQ